MISASPADRNRVLVVGGTGHLGGKVVQELLSRGKSVSALVRPGTDPSGLASKGVEIATGDMLDLDSLLAAMAGVDAVISTSAGYTRRSKQALEIDTVGMRTLPRPRRGFASTGSCSPAFSPVTSGTVRRRHHASGRAVRTRAHS